MCLKIYASPLSADLAKLIILKMLRLCASSIMLFFLKIIQKIKNHKQIEKVIICLVNASLLDFISKYLNFYTALLFHVNNFEHHRNVAVHDITSFISLSGSKIQKGFAWRRFKAGGWNRASSFVEVSLVVGDHLSTCFGRSKQTRSYCKDICSFLYTCKQLKEIINNKIFLWEP